MVYYVFETEQLAVDAEHFISQTGGTPIPSINPVNGEVDPDAVKTERWAIPWQRATDGKWVFPYVGDELASQYPESVRNYFSETFPHIFEEFSEDWRPEEEDE